MRQCFMGSILMFKDAQYYRVLVLVSINSRFKEFKISKTLIFQIIYFIGRTMRTKVTYIWQNSNFFYKNNT
jgi:hypothetical protein